MYKWTFNQIKHRDRNALVKNVLLLYTAQGWSTMFIHHTHVRNTRPVALLCETGISTTKKETLNVTVKGQQDQVWGGTMHQSCRVWFGTQAGATMTPPWKGDCFSELKCGSVLVRHPASCATEAQYPGALCQDGSNYKTAPSEPVLFPSPSECDIQGMSMLPTT